MRDVRTPGELPSRARGTALEPVRGGRGALGEGPRPVRPTPEGPDGGGSDLRAYARILRERWRIVAGVLLVVTVAVAAGTLTKPRVYRATATLEIRRQAAEVVPVEAFSQFERISDQYLQTQHAILRGPAIVRGAIAAPGIASALAAVAELDDEPADAVRARAGVDARSAALVAFVQKRMTVDPVATSRVVRVSLELEDPALAATVVNAVVAAYLSSREEAGAATLARLSEQADSVRSSVLTAEQRLYAFVQANGLGGVIVEGEGQTVPLERLRRLQEELTVAEASAYEAESVASVAGPLPAAVAESELLRTLRARIAELQGDHARLRATFTDSFPRARQLRSELARLDSLVSAEERRIATTLTGQHQATLRRRALLEAAVTEQRLLMDSLSAKVAEYERLRRDLAGQEQLYATLQQKRKEAAISAALSTMDVAILDAATPPLDPIRPLPGRDIPLGAVVGLALGLALAFLRHMTDGAVRTADDMEGITSAPLLGLIPAAPTRGGAWSVLRRGSRPEWHRIDDGASAISALEEAFSGLRTSMLYHRSDRDRRTLLVTSAQPGEGKTTVSTNLAISLARLGRRVLLIDADLRRPSLHRVFAVDSGPGLAGFLEGATELQDGIRQNIVPGLDLLTAGPAMPNPADRLSSPRMVRLLAECERSYDFVLLDAPGFFINAPDARILAHVVDGVILVVRSGVVGRDVVQRLLDRIDNLVGVVLNQVDVRDLPDYYRDYDDAATPGRARPPLLEVSPVSDGSGVWS